MSNTCYIQDAFYTIPGIGDYNEEFELSEDITYQINTDMSSFSEDIGEIANLISLVTNISSLGGTISTGTMDLQNLFDVPRWRKTDPLKINLELIAFSRENAQTEVYEKIMGLVYYSVPWFKGITNKMTLPGINLNTLGQYQKGNAAINKAAAEAGGKKQFLKGYSSLIAIDIPGQIYLDAAMVKAAIPTFSKEMTDSGFPLWGKVAAEIWSVSPVTSKMLEQAILPTQSKRVTGQFR